MHFGGAGHITSSEGGHVIKSRQMRIFILLATVTASDELVPQCSLMRVSTESLTNIIRKEGSYLLPIIIDDHLSS